MPRSTSTQDKHTPRLRGPSVWRYGAVAATTLAIVGGLTTPAFAAPEAPAALSWSACPSEYQLDASTNQCASVPVPIDYSNPDAGTIDILVTRHRATNQGESRGVLFTNPGGPGGDAIGSNSMFAAVLPDAVTSEWDLIGVQPRGLAHAGAVECSLSDEALAQLGLGLGVGATARESCTSAGSTAHLTTENTARDWNEVRLALGEESIDIYGLSYGTILGSTYATLFPQHTGRMILDSAADQDSLWSELLWLQNDGYKGRFYDLMQWLADHNDVYGLGTTPLQVYQRWSDRIVEEAGGNPTLAPPPAQVGDVPPGLLAVADAYRLGVDLTGPARVRFEAFMRSLADPTHHQTASGTYIATRQLLPQRNNWPIAAELIRHGVDVLPDGALGVEGEDLDEIIQFQMMQTLVLCNENTVAPRLDRVPGWLFSTFVFGDLFD
ncbi:MAG: alpha/beta hydrolase, partial [Rhodococcus sp.]|nr:alpha/beta hydrolase [Rhodococcus sp. (in: high G+C Gram-positive bacteria)]